MALFSAWPLIEPLFLEYFHYVIHVEAITQTRSVVARLLDRGDSTITKVVAGNCVVQDSDGNPTAFDVQLNNLIAVLRFASVSIMHDNSFLRN